MRSLRVNKTVRRRLMRHTARLLTVVLLVALFPLPVISVPSHAVKDLSTPFPCQHRRCGCMSAAQCKKKCCCFSAEQKVAWAKKNGVSVSDVVELADVPRNPPATASCCEAKSSAKKCHLAPMEKSSCQTSKCKIAGKQKGRVQVAIAAMVFKCRGVAVTAFGQPAYVLPDVVPSSVVAELTSEKVYCRTPIFNPPDLDPPVPPPRLPRS